ncbi:hypothetical protein PSTT_06723 [Puccinia striiformis]|uniref:alpha-1,2-Mannosidase n=1 Tax=Puccinia striiformis TaxID=27350 RepID=A0A2S4VJ58_9BASI|nr:hypothetical protein PSTT_06723 [Puccinia striiformis]
MCGTSITGLVWLAAVNIRGDYTIVHSVSPRDLVLWYIQWTSMAPLEFLKSRITSQQQNYSNVGFKRNLTVVMASKSSGTTTATFGAAPIRSGFRASLALALTSGLGLYFYFYSHRPVPHETARLPVGESVKEFHTWTEGMRRPVGVPDMNTTYTPSQLMSLPILHHTFEDPFDRRNGFKPLRPSQSPWSTDTESGLIYVWEDEHLIQNGQLPKINGMGLINLTGNLHLIASIDWNVRAGLDVVFNTSKIHLLVGVPPSWIVCAFFAFGWINCIDNHLDTLLIMNLTLEYNVSILIYLSFFRNLDTFRFCQKKKKQYARTHVKAIDWAHTIDMSRVTRYSSHLNTQPAISFFETVIRYMGGLISAYDLSGDELMLERAEELAEWLVPAFGTASGFPPSRYQMGSNPSGEHTGPVCLAEIGSLTLEFTRLSQLTSKKFYMMWHTLPTLVDPQSPQALSGHTLSVSAMADSYYEYLIKQSIITRDDSQYSKMPETRSGLALRSAGSDLILSPDWSFRYQYADACVWAYESTKTGVGPERISIVEGDEHTRWRPVIYQGQKFRELKSDPPPGASIEDGRYLGRPETIESVYYMWRITGDRQWQDRGWRMFTSWMEACATSFGFADLAEVNSWPPQISDKQESFVLAETFKYYYLLFSEPDLISLDEYVFNTEAHPFRLQQPSGSKGSKAEIKRYWNGSNSTLDDKYDPPGVHQNQTGFGTFLQQWSRVDLGKISDADRLVFNQVLGLLQH